MPYLHFPLIKNLQTCFSSLHLVWFGFSDLSGPDLSEGGSSSFKMTLSSAVVCGFLADDITLGVDLVFPKDVVAFPV